MQRNRKESPYLWIETALENDTLARATINKTLDLRIFSVRCRESQAQALVNQDYVQVSVLRDGSSLCFCVCDGVGSSYRGDFAARYLGTRLVKWLQTVTVSEWSAGDITARLRGHLNVWARDAQRELQQQSEPPETPALVREVLEELRDRNGSETVFFGGHISVAPWSTQLKVSHPAETFFCWMGNVTARLFVTADQCITLGGEDESVGGWSTARGPRGPLVTWNIGLTTLERLIVHTDGLRAIEQTLARLDDEALQEQARQLLLRPESDDMTALDLQWSYDRASEE